MRAPQGRKIDSGIAGLAVLLAALPVSAQNNLPPLPPPLQQRGITHSTNVPSLRRSIAPVVAAPAVPLPLPPTVNPAGVAPSPPVSPLAPALPSEPNALKWDADVKEYSAKPGETEARFTFWLTNVSSSEVLVNSVRTSCGCTVAKLPSQPWRLAPGAGGPIEVTVNLLGKSGRIAKGVNVDSSAGFKQLTVRVDLPAGAVVRPPGSLAGSMGDADRLKNVQLALADRQVVFKNQECAKCHADPAKGQSDGRLLYAAVCATCHDSPLRAAVVPDLRTVHHPTDAEHFRKWITDGRAGSMMPAFAQSEGGPLNEQQINALAEFMVKAFPNGAEHAALHAKEI